MKRPPGVFWARTGPWPSRWMCEDSVHDVYTRWVRWPHKANPEGWTRVKVWACAVCWPEEEAT